MAKKMFRLNKKSVSFGVGPLRANIGTRGVKNSLRVGGQTFSSKTSPWKGGKGKTASTASTLVDMAPAGPPVRFVTAKSKWLGAAGFSLVVIGVVMLCSKPLVGAAILGAGIFMFSRAQRIDPNAAAAALSDEGPPTNEADTELVVDDGEAMQSKEHGTDLRQ